MGCQDAQLFAALEATPGTEETPDAGEVIDFMSCTFTSGDSGPVARPNVRADYGGRPPAVPAGRWWTGSITTEVKAATAAGSAPEIANLLKAAGFGETISGGVSVTYNCLDDPNSAAYDASVTLDLEEFVDGDVYTSFGVRCGLTLNFATDAALTAEWPWVGAYKAPAAVSSLTSPTYNAGVPLVNLSDTNPFRFDTGGTPYSAILRSGSISLNMTPTPRPHMGGLAAKGYHYWPCWLSRGDNVTWEFVIEAVDQTAFPAWANRLAATQMVNEMNFAAGSRELQIIMRESVIQTITRQQGTPNTFQVTGTSAHDGTNGPLSLVFT